MNRLCRSTHVERVIVRFGLAFVIFIIVYKLIDIFALSSIAKVLVDMESDNDSVALMYYSSSLRNTSFQEEKKVNRML
ncbi:MAG: hypothetical protein VR65_13050 [Desulfobulbaceae bacterium BRH_c16a]|nr:MAG: hypothetical protein VR65_13050 [Desulfobulbaceae bacterium BRH_c16a]